MIPFRTLRVRAYAPGYDGIVRREPGDEFTIREYGDDPPDSGWYDILREATPEEVEEHTRHVGKPVHTFPPAPIGPNTGSYQHEHKGGGWWTGRHDRQTRSTTAGQTPVVPKPDGDAPVTHSTIQMPQSGDIDPRSL